MPVNDGRRIRSQFAWISVGRIVAALLQAATMLLLVRSLPPEQFGFFAAVLGLLAVPQVLFDLGLPTLVIRERARDRLDGSVTAALRLNTGLAITLATCLGALGVALALLVDARYWSLLPLAVWAAAERSADTWLGVVLADGDARINTTNLVVRRVATMGLFLASTIVPILEPMLAYSVAVAASAVGSLVFAYVYVARRLAPSDGSRMRVLLSRSYPYWINSVAAQAQNLDAAITSALAGPLQAGFYATSARLTNPLRILPASLATVLLPVAAKKTSRTLRGVLLLISGASGLFALLYLLLFAAVPFLVPFALGSAYQGAVVPLQITAIGLVFASCAALLGAVLQGVGKKNFVATISVLSTMICLAGVALGAVTNGATGAALGLASAYLVQCVALLIRLSRFVRRKEDNA
ncbi:lipopolysaccharide biosynthesis protein [Clavibacter phaseoli]|uniref:lipopolysaccharide biosynthesis protein n=1 Tax=Clavibacter phaseoli TaxID=1734031 RepID=UPI0015F9DD7A|nr:lipopolysaccharide biosynthesis protein [Clavibacter phaseoli]